MSVQTFRRTLVLGFAVALGAAMAVPTVLAQGKEPGTVVLKGAPLGGVKFDHKKHSTATKCTTCHHASKPEMPAKAANQKCTDCHTKVATAPMKTKLQAAFHDPMAKKGICIDCHVTEAAQGKKTPAPGKCADCHKKENV